MVKTAGVSLLDILNLYYIDARKNIVIEAYSPLGNNIYNQPRAVDDPEVIGLAKRLGKQPAQLLISWAVQRGTVVLPKSVTVARIKDNFEGSANMYFCALHSH
jgi:diketogulonate reductase-like aldo/keto reductase